MEAKIMTLTQRFKITYLNADALQNVELVLLLWAVQAR